MEFRRGRLQITLLIPLLGLLVWTAVDHLRAGEPLAAGANLLVVAMGCYAAVWLVRTPYASLSQGGIKLYLAPGLPPRTCVWDQISDIVPWGGHIVYIVPLTGRPIELHLREIVPESREAFAGQVRNLWQTHLTRASSRRDKR